MAVVADHRHRFPHGFHRATGGGGSLAMAATCSRVRGVSSFTTPTKVMPTMTTGDIQYSERSSSKE